MRTSHTCPKPDAAKMFDGDKIKTAYEHNNEAPPLQLLGFSEMLSCVPMLGGFVTRKGDAGPDVKTIWLSLQRVMDLISGIRLTRDLNTAGVRCSGIGHR